MDTDNDRQVPESRGQRSPEEVLSDAIRVLTEAARLRRPELQRDADGHWCKHPTDTQQADWAEFVTQALAGAAANIGSVDAALAGRPGSWEADAVRTLLHSTVGYDERYLFEHRTEPLRVVVDIEQILSDLDIAWLYDYAEAALDEMYGEATAHIDYSPYYWTYTRNDSGQYIADDPNAPAWSIEAWRVASEPAAIAWWEQDLTSGQALRASIVKSPEAARAAAKLEEQEDANSEAFHAQFDALAAQRVREWETYAEAFAANVRKEGARRYPGTSVHVDVRTTAPANRYVDDWDFCASLEPHLIEFATQHTPLPGSGIAPKDYPRDASIHATETAAGRLPHLRLPQPVTATADGEPTRG